MRGLSRTRVVREGRRYFCVPAASSERQLWPSFFALHVRRCQLCVVMYCAWGLCLHVEYRSVDTQTVRARAGELYHHVLQHDDRGPVYYTLRHMVDIVERIKREYLTIAVSPRTQQVHKSTFSPRAPHVSVIAHTYRLQPMSVYSLVEV